MVACCLKKVTSNHKQPQATTSKEIEKNKKQVKNKKNRLDNNALIGFIKTEQW